MRSEIEVEIFLNCIENTNNDENDAFKLLCEKEEGNASIKTQ